MAWTAPRTWTTGELVTASMMNTDIRDNMNALRTGGFALTSQASVDLMKASSGSQWARHAKGLALQILRMNGAASDIEWATLQYALVGLERGTNASATPANAGQVAVSGMAQDDALFVMYSAANNGNNTQSLALYNGTTSTTIIQLDTNNTSKRYGFVVIHYLPNGVGWSSVGVHFDATGGVRAVQNDVALSLANWTASYNFNLRHGGVGGGDTVSYTLVVGKFAGA